MKGSAKRTLSIFLAMLFLIGSFLVYFYFINPVYAEIKILRGKNISLKQNLENSKILNEKFEKILGDYENIKVQDKLSLMLPEKLNISYAVSQIIGIARINSLSIQSLNVKELAITPSRTSSKGLGTLRIEARMSGNYENLKLFFNNLEENLMISDPLELKIEAQVGNPSMSYSLAIDTYYQAE
ncbi:MAG: hypothetical protein AAB596_02175 [Patescibacteria group bacterium]